MARTDTLGHFLTDVADSIRTKAGTSEPIQASSFDTAIANIPSGGGPVDADLKDVLFIDYDGTILYSYTQADFANLTEMPANPTHDGLTSQGWNWNLTDAKNYVSTYKQLVIGQMYVTDDNKTRIYIKLTDNLSPILGIYLNGTLTIDWGDGTTETKTYAQINDITNLQHSYQRPGSYTIAIGIVSGIAKIGGATSYGSVLIGNGLRYNKGDCPDIMYSSCVEKIEFGSNMQFYGNSCFKFFSNLKSVTIPNNNGYTTLSFNSFFTSCPSLKAFVVPNTITQLDTSFFSNCYSLKFISLPSGMTELPGGCFLNNYSLALITIPNTVTKLTGSLFQSTYGLGKVIVPASVTTVEQGVFRNISACKYVDFTHHLSVPTLTGSTWFDVPKIVVPDALYNDWIAASQWSNLTSKIVKKSDWDASQA